MSDDTDRVVFHTVSDYFSIVGYVKLNSVFQPKKVTTQVITL